MILHDKQFAKCKEEFVNTRKLSEGGIEYLFKQLFRLGKREEEMVTRREEYEQSTNDNFEDYLKRTGQTVTKSSNGKKRSGSGGTKKSSASTKRKPASKSSKSRSTNSSSKTGRNKQADNSSTSKEVVRDKNTDERGAEHAGSITVTRRKYQGDKGSAA